MYAGRLFPLTSNVPEKHEAQTLLFEMFSPQKPQNVRSLGYSSGCPGFCLTAGFPQEIQVLCPSMRYILPKTVITIQGIETLYLSTLEHYGSALCHTKTPGGSKTTRHGGSEATRHAV